VWGLILAVLVCGVAGLEAWPFSAFRLFSQVRTSHTLTYRLAVVNHAGRERSLPFRALPPGFRGLNLDLAAAAADAPANRRAVCDVIVRGARELHRDVSLVGVYAIDRDLSRRVGRISRATSRLAFACAGEGGADAGG
jgi:hypothetical protein